ncbi:accessory Sec system glycosyltransferase Asp1 [Weissella diestrammenae]|uniref:Accessory Sec system glycosyltransferase Asp1 n=1 Tax=Weissella diestrammenae TaxID=1162633 RepID=A0A7G9T5I0_9LACO|nr:accessory Sec system glycosyltransferase Asp1 [Weissella diestrammenae]MCM0583216.1 accessory Sec system glycosyltransferase Asp1 [Weissella diestrammenae]QNN75355.1 accessory Sec system glycosyltransferase Asp1 [Weissella diestrammenae]
MNYLIFQEKIDSINMKYLRRMVQILNESEQRIIVASPGNGLHFWLENFSNAVCINIFGTLQAIPQNTPIIKIDIRDLDWPENSEFIYQGSSVMVMVKEEKYAEIKYANHAIVERIIYFKNNKETSEIEIDVRGFIRSRTVYDEKMMKYYFDYDGSEIFFENLKTREVVVKKSIADKNELKNSYVSLNELSRELLQRYLSQQLKPYDNVYISSMDSNIEEDVINIDENINIIDIISSRKVINVERNDTIYTKRITRMAELGLCTPKEVQKYSIIEFLPEGLDLSLGNSKKYSKTKIVVYIDENTSLSDVIIAPETFEDLDDSVEVIVYTLNANNTQVFDKDVDRIEIKRFDAVEFASDLKNARVFITFGSSQRVDFYNIQAMIFGIPMISDRNQKYLQVDINEKIFENVKQFTNALGDYLKNIELWNEVSMNNLKWVNDFEDEMVKEKIKMKLK